ncbi:MAG: hypothetical protein A4E57_03878 [Syntrophorhabdaceae bacterium PtaU1.Bin034]|nr:MAG: hypothetical protein A4E57_03878 [Syntrophorhabdaceae bacterium PtaU1.Bin034]
MPGMVLKKGKLSAAFQARFRKYYSRLSGMDPSYTEIRWGSWKDNPAIIVYTARNDNGAAGWIVYNPQTSVIEEILTGGEEQQEAMLDQMIDALIARENLVAAEILSVDRERYGWMVKYGFRPTRSYSASGFAFRRMDLSTSVFFQRRDASRPAKQYGRKERVVIERVPGTQTGDEIKGALRKLIDNLGGVGRFVKEGQTVVIKPNVVADHGIQNGVYVGGVVTDIRVLTALIELLLPVAGKVIVAEGSSINRSQTGKMFAHYGYDKIVEIDRQKVSLVDLNTDKLVEKPVPAGKRMTARKVPVTLEEADVIISLPVMKIHFAAGVSLAVKNLQGTMPPLEKYMSHFFGLWQNLVNIHHLVKPDLTIVDALTAQEDFGPVSGTPKKMDLLMAGTNPVAVDTIAMRIMGLEPQASPPVLLAYLEGLGPVEPDRIEVVGPSINELVSPFKLPHINVESGKDFVIHDGGACTGCRGYLHFVLNKLRRPDPRDATRLLIDRPFEQRVNVFLGPQAGKEIDPKETNIFMGICQQHHAEVGSHLAGCPPHAEVIMNGIFRLFPDVERPKYADETEEAKLERMLKEVLELK